MKQIIQLLPDPIANQIAAGEVVQRPASVVKELMENAVDAGATHIELILRDAGKALIQVIDNGSGMSAADARLSFERHATSKIRSADDLFRIQTMGFRGEALASIAAVAQVVMRTRLHDEELGTEIVIEGSEVKKQEPVNTPPGTNFMVKNLFFNVPARRNFLKSNPVETRHILAEFTHVALAFPELTFKLEHNGSVIYHLHASTPEKRIAHLLGEDATGRLGPVEENTPYLSIRGYAGHPQFARKARGEQYFFVNKRFIRNPYLHHAVMTAYKDLLTQDSFPFYCIFLGIAPEHIDVNIHPTKTEIKFDDERAVYSLLHSAVRRGLALLHDLPSADPSPPLLKPEPEAEQETIGNFRKSWTSAPDAKGWETLFGEKMNQPGEVGKLHEEVQSIFDQAETPAVQENIWLQIQSRYILTEIRGSLLLIDQQHAHQRVLYEQFIDARQKPPLPSQQLLFPRTLSFSPADMQTLRDMEAEFRHLGFDMREFGPDRYILNGVPPGVSETAVQSIFEEAIASAREAGHGSAAEKWYNRLARAVAMRGATAPGKRISVQEMKSLTEALFQCAEPQLSPAGKPVYYTLGYDHLEQFFRKN